MKKYILLLIALLSSVSSWAYVIYKTGSITYRIYDTDASPYAVVYQDSANATKLSGTVEIPATVTLNDVVYNITKVSYWRYGNKVDLVIPNSITEIAWSYIYELHSLSLPSTYTSFDLGNIRRQVDILKLPASLTSLTPYSNTSYEYGQKRIEAFEVAAENTTYKSIDGVVFTKDETKLVVYPYRKDGVSYTVPVGVTTIGVDAFYDNNKLETVNLPSGLKEIETGSFDHCDNLYECQLPTSIQTIGVRAFYNCKKYAICGDFSSLSALTTIGEYAFSNCSITLDNNTFTLPGAVKNIDNHAFYSSFKNYGSATVVFPATLGLDGSQLVVGSYAFNCNVIRALMTDPVNSNDYAFYNVSKIYVPASINSTVLNTYKYKTGWNINDGSKLSESASLIIDETLVAPTINKILDAVNSTLSVKFSTTSEGATIKYYVFTSGEADKDVADWFTYNGTDVIPVADKSTVKAITYKAGSYSTTSEYYLNISDLKCPAPNIITATNSTSMTMATSIEGASIYYTTDNSTPSQTNGTKYTGQITLDGNFTYQAVVIKEGMFSSDPSYYNVTWFKCKTPTVTYAAATPDGENVVVTMSTDEEGATMKYRVGYDGDYINYTAPVNMPVNSYFYYKATKESLNYTESDNPYIYTNKNNIKCAKPSIAVDPDTKKLSLTSEAGYDIYYTLNGELPKVNDIYKYGGTPVDITTNCTILAIAHKAGMFQSDQSSTSVSNWFKCPLVNIEQILVDGTPKMKLSLADSTSVDITDMDIYYVINNYWSSQDSWMQYGKVYDNPVFINNGNYISAVAIKSGYLMSSNYTRKTMDYSCYQTCAMPNIYLDNETKKISITTSEPNGKIYYTLDGTLPSTASTEYSEPFSSDVNCIVMAITAREAETIEDVTTFYANSSATSVNLDDWFRLENVKFVPILGESEGEYKMELKAEEGATIEYGINEYGNTIYDEPFAVSPGDRVYAKATKAGFVESYWNEYYINDGNYTVRQPSISVDEDTREISVYSETEGASIYYTSTGEDPTTESTMLEGGKITTTRNCQYKFIAVKNGMYNSSVSTYTVNWFRVPQVEITAYGEDNQLKVKMTCEDPNATIYYGIGSGNFNSDDITANAKYTEPFVVRDGSYITASALRDGYNNAYNSYLGYIYESSYRSSTPTITVAADLMVSITGEEGSTFYYTLDGTDPTLESTEYIGKFALTENTTIKAFAVVDQKLYSQIRTNNYSNFYCSDVVAEQIFENGMPKMKLTCETPGSTIYYGVGYYGDTKYTAPIEAYDGASIYFRASKERFNDSNWGSAYMSYSEYVQCSQPSIEINNEAKTVSITTSEEKGVIYYTLDGTTPTTASNKYSTPFTSDVNCTIKAITARDAEEVDGKVVTYANSYVSETNLDEWFRLENVKFVPVVGAAEGLYRLAMEAEEGAIIEYGINNYGGTIYTDTIDVPAGSYVYAMSRKEGRPDSYWREYYISSYNYTVQMPNINANQETRVLTITTETEGADIYYTTGSAVPTIESNKLVGNEITVSRNDTLNFIAVKKDMYSSSVNTYNVNWFRVPTVAVTPFAENNAMKVRLECEDADATIYYGIGEFNNDNVRANALYEGPFEVQSGNYVYSSAVKDGFNNASRTSTYINYSDYTCSSPTITIAADTTVTISGGTGETIYYTLDGTDPTTSSTKFTSKFKLSKNVTIKAIAATSGKLNSSVRERSYSGFRVNSVTITPYVENNKLMVKLETKTPGATIYYALNNWNSTLTSNIAYSAPFEISEINNGAYIYANATKDGFNDAGMSSHDWLYISNFTASTPTVTLESDTTVILSADVNSTIYYTLDGSTPTTSSTKYTSKFKLDRNVSLRAIATESGKINSSVYEYDYNNFRVAYPTFSLDGITLTISTTTPDAVIYYAFGDDAVADENANKYTGPFTLPDNRRVTAIATREGWNNSNSRSYNPSGVVKCPLVKQESFDGHYMTLSTVEGATIYYRTDGQEPNTWNSSVYEGPIAINQVGTVKAKAIHPYMTESDVATFEVEAYAGDTGATTMEAGGLEASMAWADLETITEFAISGPINTNDMSFIKSKMTSLEKLDLSDATPEGGIIPDNAFAGLPLVTFSSPNALKSVGKNIFSGCKELAAVIWNTTAKIPNDAFDDDVNPNLLIFVPAEDAAPNTSSVRNIIVNNTADRIYLSDGANNNFYSPKQFYTKNITYTHDFTLATGSSSGWETICLPFDCSYFVHESKGELKPFAEYNDLSDKGNYKPFWLRELTDIGYKDVKKIEAHKPYLISMPNNESYASRYRLNGKVTFSATNVYVPQTVQGYAEKGDITMYANFMNVSETSDMLLLNTEADADHEAGSIFVLNSGRAIRPFEAYVISRARSRAYISMSALGGGTDDDATAITENTIDDSNMVKVYNLSGVLVKQSSKEDALKGLAKGVYIVNGKRMIVK